MSNADDLWLRYVLNELDPSEARLVEETMLEDENALIEIESLRITLKKLEHLPEYSPPAQLREELLRQAAAQAERNRKQYSRRRLFHLLQLYSMPAAAAMFIALGLGFFLHFISSSQEPAPPAAAAVHTGSELPLPAATPKPASEMQQVRFSGFGQAATNVSTWPEQRPAMRIQVTNGVSELTRSDVRFTQFQNQAAPKPADRRAFDFTSKPRDFHLIQTAR
ncbi:MAG: hypothetical protein LAT75_09370 [Candidatus Cyclonatronum sp.]|uniref:hypothetical protein n=1 Tax=Cyclonatronum sp. TaxID=3024185 RepID=UPI0025BF848F|nr:hypothetical protein [Cyclonatronum sp.]MCH8487066.1 hypothetical protein [Cyclonatronum sp.]